MTIQNSKVKESVKKFRKVTKKSNWKDLEKELIQKRLRWFKENKKYLNLKGDDLEKAYRLILKKIGIKSKEAPVIKRTKTELIFHSKNFCPALEACKILDLDTKKVCKKVFEKPTEELIKKINPKLRFTRNYKKIRPCADYCEEKILLLKLPKS